MDFRGFDGGGWIRSRDQAKSDRAPVQALIFGIAGF